MMAGHTFMVTAATTSLGRRVVAELAQHGRVVGLRSPLEPTPQEGEAEAHLADLTRSDDARKAIVGLAADSNVDTLVHLGSHGPATERPATANAKSTRLLLDAAEHVASIRTFVLRSTALLYRAHSDDPSIADERHPLDFSAGLSARHRDWLEADLAAVQRVAASTMRIAVLRLSALLAPDNASPLFDYLHGPRRLRPMGFDPMLNVLSIDDAARALALAARNAPRGVFNVAGAETLPLSELLHRLQLPSRPVPGAWIELLDALRRRPATPYAEVRALLHHGLVVDGRAAASAFGYRPAHPLRLFG